MSQAEAAMQLDTTGSVATVAERDRFPAGIPFIVGNEGAERFSFYGMKAILYVYLTSLFVKLIGADVVPTADMALARAHATEVVHLFIAGVYAFPLVGAILSDRLLGKYNVIFWVSLVYVAGNAVMAFAGKLGMLGNIGGAEVAVYGGLALIAIGSGGIKPCVSANVGDQFTKANSHLVTKIFQIFYFIINFGSFFSTLLTPLLYRYFGPAVAFGVPGVLMTLATIIFWLGRKKLVRVPAKPGGKLGLLDTAATLLLLSPIFALITGAFFTVLPYALAAMVAGFGLFLLRQRIAPDSGFLAVLIFTLRNQRTRKANSGFFSVAKEHFGEEAAEGPPAVLKIMVVFSMVSVFWALFDQHSSTWIEQAKRMDLGLSVPHYLGWFVVVAVFTGALYGGTWLLLRVGNIAIPRRINVGFFSVLVGGALVAASLDAVYKEWMTFALQASQLAALNPLMVMIIIPLLNVAVYAPLEQRGITPKPLQKMTVGMFLAAAAFAVAALLQTRIELVGDGQVHALWQAFQYVVITVAEVLVSVTGLEFAYTQAPRAMKSTIMGFWLLCVTFGNLLVAFLAPLQASYELSQFFWLFSGLMVAAATVFVVLAYFYKGKSYMQEARS
ncbi:MAG: hypothetical protein AAB426_13615 [Myxococcota bacterium]